jgi:hypothetical protein
MTYLTPRWTDLRPHPIQNAYSYSRHRFNVVPAGRRSGKTEIFKRRLVRAAMRGSAFGYGYWFAAAPTRDQAKQIFWRDLKALVPRWSMVKSPSESELIIFLSTGQINVVGMDKPQRIEGTGWDGGGMDEYASMKESAWPENVYPALTDRNGWCDLIGVPEGRNHYYKQDQEAQKQYKQLGEASQWRSFHWKSAEILSPEAIAQARRDLDPLTFEQEYEASFLNFQGRIYYPFDVRTHCAPLSYDPDQPLSFLFDFNTSPGVAAVAQEQELPSGDVGTGIIGEVYIPDFSTTPVVCRKLLEQWGKHRGRVVCYGDATGGAGGSAKVMGSDWDLIRNEFRPHFGDRLRFNVQEQNPRERVRINSVNTRLLAGDGAIKLMVDEDKCPNVVRDFEGVRVLEGSAGEIDKKSDPTLTHLTDAIGYYVWKRWPVEGHRMATSREMRV